MKLWLTQRAEPTPHDGGGRLKPMRTGAMADYFSKHDWDVTWWTSDFDHYGQCVRGHGETCLPVTENYRIQYLQNDGYKHNRSIQRLVSDQKIGRDFKKLTQRIVDQPDVIIASMPSVDLALKSVYFANRKKIPVIVDIRDLHPDVFVDLASKAFRPLVKLATLPMRRKVHLICKNATAIWGNTNEFVEWGCRNGSRNLSPLDKTFSISHLPVSLTLVERNEAHQQWNSEGLFRPDEFNIIFFGTLSKSFDFSAVFEASRLLQSSQTRHRFYFFGRGELEAQVREHCKANTNSRFLGWNDSKKLQVAMERSHIGLAPYLPISNYIKNAPNKPAEYLSGGLGVATSLPSGFLLNILEKSNAGFSYKSGAHLAERLTHLATNNSAIANMQTAACSAFKANFDYDQISKSMMMSIEDVVSAFRSGANLPHLKASVT